MFNNKTILITGGTGSWGRELTRQLLEKYNPKEIRVYSRHELAQVNMKREFNAHPKIKFIIGDVRDFKRLDLTCMHVDYIFHLAALKHVPVCEENPWEAVLTNIDGTQNVIEAAIKNDIKKVIDISTDKAVDPFNLYGATKAVAERLIIAANTQTDATKFVCIRGGNVLGTTGSVVPLFHSQIIKTNQVTITDEGMSRYFLSLKDAIGLIFKASIDSVGGEIFVMKMPSCKIVDLAKAMIKELGNKDTKIKTIGIRPGEKIHEVLVSKYESTRVIEDGKYYIILPMVEIAAIEKQYKGKKTIHLKEYSSETAQHLSEKEIREMLAKDGWLEKSLSYDKSMDQLSDKNLVDYFKREGWVKK